MSVYLTILAHAKTFDLRLDLLRKRSFQEPPEVSGASFFMVTVHKEASEPLEGGSEGRRDGGREGGRREGGREGGRKGGGREVQYGGNSGWCKLCMIDSEAF